MDDPSVDHLERLQHHTEALVAQHLRSVSAVIARLREVIGQAHAMGHSHAAIHARLCAGGLELSWNNYRAALQRARRGAAGAPPTTPTVPTTEAPMAATRAVDTVAGAPSSAPMQLLDALASAQRTAARDYAPLARANGRRTRTPS